MLGKMKKVKYPLFDIDWNEKDIQSISKVIRRGNYWTMGKEIAEFEKKITDYLGVNYVVLFNSGTSALFSILKIIDIMCRDVIIPSFSFISTANSVVLAGGVPVFCDIEKETMGLDADKVIELIDNHTRAILPMHYGGKVCRDIEKLEDIAREYNLYLIEDNAESFGAILNDRFAGTFGDASILSFCQNKIITTGEGGAVYTNNKIFYNKLLLMRSHGRVKNSNVDYFSNINESDYIDIGHNFRMSSISASLGSSQMNRIEKMIYKRRKIGKFYNDQLSKISQIRIFPELENQRSVYQLYSFLLKEGNRNDLQEFLLKNGILSKVYFSPIHMKKYYKKIHSDYLNISFHNGLKNTEEISKKILSIPFSVNFTEKDILFIVNKIKEFYRLYE